MSEKLFELHREILAAALDLVSGCGCEHGCPSCVGPTTEVGSKSKANAADILIRLVRAAKVPAA
jgi:DEAD/DEAH box helicase domain-containing protein